MTAAQQARTSGFQASLSVRGVSLALEIDVGDMPLSFKGLIERETPAVPEFGRQIQKSENVHVHVLRTNLNGRKLVTGNSLLSEESRFRIVSVEDNSVNVAVVFTCRESPAP